MLDGRNRTRRPGRALAITMLLAVWSLGSGDARAQRVKGIKRPPTKPVVSSKEAMRPRPPLLQVELGGGEFSEWTYSKVFHGPERIAFRWSTAGGIYHHGQWQVSTVPFRPEPGATIKPSSGLSGRLVVNPAQSSSASSGSGKSLSSMKTYNPIKATGGTGQAPAGGGKVAKFTVNSSLFTPGPPSARPVKYYVRVVPLDEQNQVAGPASTQVILRYAQPGEPTEFTPEGIWTESELSRAKHDAAPRVRLALAQIVEALEYLNPAYESERDAKDVRGANYSMLDDEVIAPFPWDRDPMGLMTKAESWIPRARRLATHGPLRLEGDLDPIDMSVLQAIADVIAPLVEELYGVDVEEYGKKAGEYAKDNPPAGAELYGKGSGAPIGPEYWDSARAYVLSEVLAIIADAEKWLTSRP